MNNIISLNLKQTFKISLFSLTRGSKVMVTLYLNGKIWKDMNGSILRFDTINGENIIVVRNGTTPEQFKQVIP